VGMAQAALDHSTAAQKTGELAAVLADLRQRYGNWKIEWGDICRYQRLTGKILETYDDKKPSLPAGLVQSTFGELPSFVSRVMPGTSKRYGYSGNSFIAAVEFGKRVTARTVIRYRSMAGVAHAVAAGMGLARLPAHFFKDPQFKDVLTPVLTDHPVWQTTLYIVYASRKFVPLKIRTFADFLLLELARREETQQRRCAPLEVGVSTTNGSPRSRLAFVAPVV